jgi:hypothetical protein
VRREPSNCASRVILEMRIDPLEAPLCLFCLFCSLFCLNPFNISIYFVKTALSCSLAASRFEKEWRWQRRRESVFLHRRTRRGSLIAILNNAWFVCASSQGGSGNTTAGPADSWYVTSARPWCAQGFQLSYPACCRRVVLDLQPAPANRPCQRSP